MGLRAEAAYCHIQFASMNDPGDEVARPTDSQSIDLIVGQWAKEDAISTNSHSLPRRMTSQHFDIRIRRKRHGSEGDAESKCDSSKLRFAA